MFVRVYIQSEQIIDAEQIMETEGYPHSFGHLIQKLTHLIRYQTVNGTEYLDNGILFDT